MIVLDEVKEVCEELVASFQHTQSNQWRLQVTADILGQFCSPKIVHTKLSCNGTTDKEHSRNHQIAYKFWKRAYEMYKRGGRVVSCGPSAWRLVGED